MDRNASKAAALLVTAVFLDTAAADDAVITAQNTARDFRSRAAVATHTAINIDRVTTTTAVSSALVATGEGIAKDMRFTVNSAVGYFATVGMLLLLTDGGTLPEDDSAARFMWDVKEVGQKWAKEVIRRADMTTGEAYAIIHAEAERLISERKAEAAAAKQAERTDLYYLQSAAGPIGKAVGMVKTEAGTDAAHALIAQLIAQYGAPVAAPATLTVIPAQGGALATAS
jgi:hypothetical protein